MSNREHVKQNERESEREKASVWNASARIQSSIEAKCNSKRCITPPIRLVENALSHSIHKKRIEHSNSSESEYTMCNVHDLGNMRAACEEENPTTFWLLFMFLFAVRFRRNNGKTSIKREKIKVTKHKHSGKTLLFFESARERASEWVSLQLFRHSIEFC